MATTRSGVPSSARRRDLGWLLGVAFLTLQVAWVLASQFRESRHFSWAPHTVQVQYRVAVEIDGQPLPPDAVHRRYGVPAEGWEAHSHRNLIELIEQYETTRGREDAALVLLEYRVNGRSARLWRGP